MRWPWSRPVTATPAAVIPAPQPTGIFSTDIRLPEVPESAWHDYFSKLDSRVFQRTLAATDSTGRVIPGTAMDDGGLFNLTSLKQTQQLSGYGVPDVLVSWYASQGFIGYQMCAVLLQHWFIDKACSMPARDAMRKGFEIGCTTDAVTSEALDELRAIDKRMSIGAECTEAMRMCRAYGIRIVMFRYDGVDYEQPFNPDGIRPGAYRGISQIDPYWITPELIGDEARDPTNPNFYNPTFWRVNGKRYHRSHLVILRTCKVPDVLAPTYFFGGIPLPQRIYERVYAAERTANEAPQLAMTKRLTVLNADVSAAVAKQGATEKALQNFAYFRDNYGVKLIGLNEKAQQFDTTLTDVSDVIGQQFQLCCAMVGVPVTKMLGVQPKGFNATGEYEEASYHEELNSMQEHDALPIIERHHLLAKLSFVCPKFGLPLFKTTVEFNPLDEETAEQAATRRKTNAETAKIYADAGAIDGIDIRDNLRSDPESGWDTLPEAIPEGPRPLSVIDPGAEKTAPNAPTPQEAVAPGATGGGNVAQ